VNSPVFVQDAVESGAVFFHSANTDARMASSSAALAGRWIAMGRQRPVAEDAERGHALTLGFGQSPGA